jgi:hypothetical protein
LLSSDRPPPADAPPRPSRRRPPPAWLCLLGGVVWPVSALLRLASGAETDRLLGFLDSFSIFSEASSSPTVSGRFGASGFRFTRRETTGLSSIGNPRREPGAARARRK